MSELEQQDKDDVDLMCNIVKKKVFMHWVKKFQAHLDKDIVISIPKEFAAIVSIQVIASISQIMFTRATVLLVQSIDETCEQHEFFKRLDLVQLGAEDEQSVAILAQGWTHLHATPLPGARAEGSGCERGT